MFSVVLTILSMIAISKAEELGVFFQIEEKSLLLSEDAIWNGEVNSLLSCSHICARQALCKSASYITEGGTCSIHRETKRCIQTGFCNDKGLSTSKRFVICHVHVQGQLNLLPSPLSQGFLLALQKRSYFE